MERFWYKDAIVYGIDVDAFQDANGDGIGDFRGLTERLSYLAELGVTCLWVLPFFPSPDRDNGYDISNYYGVAARVGTFDDFVTFLQRAGEHGIRVILDLVVNHTSDQHPWFQAGRRDRRSRYHDYYVWTESPPPTPAGKGNILEENTVWTYDEVAGAYYYHRFYHFQPSLKMSNPEVRDEVARALDFWLSFPIAGFRIDAASHLIEARGLDSTKPGDPHGILKNLRHFVEDRRAGAVLVGEADVPVARIADYFGDGDELQMVFNFLLNNYLFLALAREEAEPIIRCLGMLPAIPQEGQWLNFLRNLDEVDLERLTDAEREEVYQKFAPDPDMRIFDRGIRRRLAAMLRNQDQLEMAWSLLFSLPGTPVIVYGDEIGMGDDLSQQGRNAVRAPMQWSSETNAGFSDAPAESLKHPVIAKGDLSYKKVNVEAQRGESGSLLSWMKEMIAARRTCPEFGRGAVDVIGADQKSVLAHRCRYQRDSVVAIHNLAGKQCKASLGIEHAERQFDRLLGNGELDVAGDGTCTIRLPKYGYAWFRVHELA